MTQLGVRCMGRILKFDIGAWRPSILNQHGGLYKPFSLECKQKHPAVQGEGIPGYTNKNVAEIFVNQERGAGQSPHA